MLREGVAFGSGSRELHLERVPVLAGFRFVPRPGIVFCNTAHIASSVPKTEQVNARLGSASLAIALQGSDCSYWVTSHRMVRYSRMIACTHVQERVNHSDTASIAPARAC
jgi:hypothetical protein